MESKIKVNSSLYIRNGKYNVMFRYKEPRENRVVQKSMVIKDVAVSDKNKPKAEKIAERMRAEFERKINEEIPAQLSAPVPTAFPYPYAVANPYQNVLLGEAMEQWIELHREEYQSNTYNSYKSYIGRMKEYFDTRNITVGMVTPDTILQFHNYLLSKSNKQGKTISQTTLQHYYNILHKYFNSLADNDYIVKNPVDKVKKPKVDTKTEHFIPYTQNDIKEFLELFKGKLIYPCVCMAIMTGLRRSELLALTWADTDFEQSVIHICHKIALDSNPRYTGKDKEPKYIERDSGVMKTKSSERDIPMTKGMKYFLRKLQLENRQNLKKHGRVQENGKPKYIFIKPDGKRISLSGLSDGFARTVKNSRFPLTFHELRHMTASLMLNNGVSLKMIQQILGHSSITTTANIYAHVNQDNLRSALNAVSDIIEW